MRVLCTGAAGFVGSHLCDRLIADGHQVRGIDNLQTGRRENLPADADKHGEGWFWQGDIAAVYDTGPSAAENLADHNPEVIIHCAASYSDRDKWHRDTATNVQGAINVAIAAKACGARVIYFQTALVYGNNPYADRRALDWPMALGATGLEPSPLRLSDRVNPENSYAISKYAGGQYLRHSGIPLLELRLANIYGPRNLSGPIPTFYKRLAAGEPCTITDSRRDFVYIDDLVDLVMVAIEREVTGTYHVSTGTDYAIKDVYAAVAENVASEGEYTVVARGPDDAPTILLDPSQTEKDFGWKASTPLDEGVAAACGWYAAHGVTDTFTHLAVKG